MKLFNFHGSNSKLLLPTVFKKCGFNCVNYDNEFLVTNNYDIWYDNKLISDALYSYRNNSCTDLDEDMLNKMKINGTRHNFYFIHLVGQHFPYNKHFPKSYCKFNSKDYQTKYGKDADQQLADYDNCTLYNDYIIYSIIKKFENRHAIVFYLPDHGEELYDYRNFEGHGNTIHDRKGLVQVEIPFVIWVSSKYKKDHPEIISKLYKSVNNKFISTMLSNTVLDAAGIKCIYSNPTFSIINDKFDNKRHRITAYGYDYDGK
jgi:heptose-I-phosphate ethanolaminephosphotransferase